jgi:hypothetical protein
MGHNDIEHKGLVCCDTEHYNEYLFAEWRV